VVNRLKEWGFDDGLQLRVVGHSLGSIMSSEISFKTRNQAMYLIALDPPSENTKSSVNSLDAIPFTIIGIKDYYKSISIDYFQLSKKDNNKSFEDAGNTKYQINNTQVRRDFQGTARNSRAFYGKFSFAGNRQYASTAKESFEMDFHFNDYFNDLSKEHQLVHKTFKSMIKDIVFTQENDNSDRVLHLDDISTDHSKTWLRKMGRKESDHGQIDSDRGESVKSMEVEVKSNVGLFENSSIIKYRKSN
jgi:hypothetical protein